MDKSKIKLFKAGIEIKDFDVVEEYGRLTITIKETNPLRSVIKGSDLTFVLNRAKNGGQANP